LGRGVSNTSIDVKGNLSFWEKRVEGPRGGKQKKEGGKKNSSQDGCGTRERKHFPGGGDLFRTKTAKLKCFAKKKREFVRRGGPLTTLPRSMIPKRVLLEKGGVVAREQGEIGKREIEGEGKRDAYPRK